MDNNAATQAQIYYAGTVQGVGFRYTCRGLALRLGLTGWVKNLADGRVEILVEGPKEKINDLCANIESHFSGHIRNKDITFNQPQGQFHQFQITP